MVKNTTDNTSTLVKTVDSDTQLSLQSNIFTSGEGYKIFRPPAHTLNFDNEVASLKIEGDCCWTLFTDSNFHGVSMKLNVGVYQSASGP